MGKFLNSKTIAADTALNTQPSISNRSTIAATTVTNTAKNSGMDRTGIIDTFTNTAINRITDNPFYFFINMSKTKVTFYNIDKDKTTLDEVVDNTYNFIGPASGLRFDKIIGCIIYGMQHIELNIDMTDFGTEADPIEGEAYLLPNTFVPYQNSYFSIDYLNSSGKEVLFRITSVNIDTFPNGSNFYKISYKLESIGEDISPQVVKTYQYLSNNVGTGSVLVDADSYNLSNEISDYINELKDYYYELFFQQSTQTFVFKYGVFDYFFYDAFLIQFLMNSRIFATNDDNYVHVCQPAYPPPMLDIDYRRTIWYLLEHTDSTQLSYFVGYGLMVQDPMSLLVQRMEPYYMVGLRDDNGNPLASPLLEPIPIVSNELLELLGYNVNDDGTCCKCEACKESRVNEILNSLPNNKLYIALIYKYISGITLTFAEIKKCITSIRYVPCRELYYVIPMLIYILTQIMNNLNNGTINADSMNNNGMGNNNYIEGEDYNSCPRGCLECKTNASENT